MHEHELDPEARNKACVHHEAVQKLGVGHHFARKADHKGFAVEKMHVGRGRAQPRHPAREVGGGRFCDRGDGFLRLCGVIFFCRHGVSLLCAKRP